MQCEDARNFIELKAATKIPLRKYFDSVPISVSESAADLLGAFPSRISSESYVGRAQVQNKEPHAELFCFVDR